MPLDTHRNGTPRRRKRLAAPSIFHPRCFEILDAIIVRTCYYEFFSARLPAGLHGYFRRATRDAEVNELRGHVLRELAAARRRGQA